MMTIFLIRLSIGDSVAFFGGFPGKTTRRSRRCDCNCRFDHPHRHADPLDSKLSNNSKDRTGEIDPFAGIGSAIPGKIIETRCPLEPRMIGGRVIAIARSALGRWHVRAPVYRGAGGLPEPGQKELFCSEAIDVGEMMPANRQNWREQ